MQPILPFETNSQTEYGVQYLPYDTEFPVVFERLKNLIQGAVDSITVEHVGSTSIPGVGGRGAIDLAVPVLDAQRQALRSAILGLGFRDSPFPHYLPLLVGRFEWRDVSYPVLLYLVPPDSPVYLDWLRFRAHMRSHATDRRQYDEVKRQAIGSGNVDGDQYQAAKTPFVEALASKLR